MRLLHMKIICRSYWYRKAFKEFFDHYLIIKTKLQLFIQKRITSIKKNIFDYLRNFDCKKCAFFIYFFVDEPWEFSNERKKP